MEREYIQALTRHGNNSRPTICICLPYEINQILNLSYPYVFIWENNIYITISIQDDNIYLSFWHLMGTQKYSFPFPQVIFSG